MRIRTYYELRRLPTFQERFDYLALRGVVGETTFGTDRYLNQQFYRSTQWKNIRNQIIARDNGCDLGIDGYEIFDKIYIHHLNPMTVKDLVDGNESVLEPEYLISTTHRTHNAIHYGDASLLYQPYVERKPGDTKLW
jgi:hypothetical protein